jgi:tRNA (guanine-N7-)-methyltransferase
MTPPPTWGPTRSFGRIKSRTLKPRQAALMETLLPRIALPDPTAGPIDPQTLMPGAAETWLEIGFGGGEHMAEQSARRPDVLVIGCEPFLNGVGSALRHIDERSLGNVRLHAGDARLVLDALPDACLDKVFILFPDPWPKARHHKRRLIQDESLSALVRAMKPGATLRFVTDWKAYAAWTLERAVKTPGLAWLAEDAAAWREAPADHVATRYQEKLLGDTAPIYLEFARTAN